jgi:hypothetical protein
VRISVTNEISIIANLGRLEFTDITNQTGLPTTGQFVTIANIDGIPILILVSAFGFLEFYDLHVMPFVNMTEDFHGIPRVPVVTALVVDMNNDKLFDLIVLSQFSTFICYNQGIAGYTSFLPVLLTVNNSHRIEQSVDITIADLDNDMLSGTRSAHFFAKSIQL